MPKFGWRCALHLKGWLALALCAASMGLVHAASTAAPSTPAPAPAGSIETLTRFFATHKSGQMNFMQRGASEPHVTGSGSFSFEKPNRLRWHYDKPDPLDLISDGKVLWQYDPTLRQAVRQDISQGFGATPAALFAGEALEQVFVLQALPARDGLAWVRATPLRDDPSLASLVVGFDANSGEPRRIELTDHFNRTSLISLSQPQWNLRLPPETFRFTPPAGVDVLSR